MFCVSRLLEVCVDCLESAKNAFNGGAARLEVCSSLAEGGLTPSAGLLSVIKSSIPDISVYAMLRCRSGSDFCYTADEIQVMLCDLQIFKNLGVNGFVFGALNINGSIDEDSCKKIISGAHPLPVTFHRAFDVCQNPLQSLETIIELKFERVLTSGQQGSAGSDMACNLIKEMVSKAEGRIVIMAGAGVSLQNINRILDTGVDEIHGSLKTKKQLPVLQNRIEMGSNASSGETINITDEHLVRNLVTCLTEYHKPSPST